MKPLNILEKIIYWLLEKSCRYNCEKGRHRWVYTLSESGIVYLDDKQVPKDLWHCSECGVKKY